MRVKVPYRKWRYSGAGMVLIVTKEYRRVMLKLPASEIRTLTHRIIPNNEKSGFARSRNGHLMDGDIYDEITIETY